MAMSDPLGDMLARIRNGQAAKQSTVTCPASRLRKSVLEVLQREGYIRGYSWAEHAKGIVAAALATLDTLADRGWRALVGDPPSGAPADGRRRALGGDAVAERTESFDPLAGLD